MATVWNQKPAYTDAQIKARFGPGARLVRRGDGKWTVAGVSAAPSGVTGNTGSAGSAVPAPPPPPPVSFGQQANITNLISQRAGLSGIYNPQRQALFAEGARGLTDQGYFDIATPLVASTDPATGAVTYSVAGQGEGRLTREAMGSIRASANSRGMLFSSATRTGQRQARGDLENARQAALRRLGGEQDTITARQTQDYTGLSGQIGQAQGDYTDWRASQAVPLPAPASETVAATPRPAAAAAPGGLPRIIRNPGAGSIDALRRRGYKRAGGSGNVWVLA